MTELTKRQEEVLDFIAMMFKASLIQPTVREIGAHFGFKSTTTTADYIRALVRKGWLEYGPESATRSLRFTLKSRLKYGLFWTKNTVGS